MKILAALIAFSFVASAEPTTKVACTYSVEGVPISTSQLNLLADGAPEAWVLVSMGPGSPLNKYTVTPDVLQAEELVHVWISKEQPDGAIEMITYKEPQKDGTQGKMINHNVPLGQEMSGPCTVTKLNNP